MNVSAELYLLVGCPRTVSSIQVADASRVALIDALQQELKQSVPGTERNISLAGYLALIEKYFSLPS